MNPKIEKIVDMVCKPFNAICVILTGVGFALMFSSPLVWVWFGFELAFKIGISGLICVFLFESIRRGIRNTVAEVIEDEIKEMTKTPDDGLSKFQRRINELQKAKAASKPHEPTHN